MKKQTLTFAVKQPKHRNHVILFCENTPFKQKVVERKNLYRRKPKHVGRNMEQY